MPESTRKITINGEMYFPVDASGTMKQKTIQANVDISGSNKYVPPELAVKDVIHGLMTDHIRNKNIQSQVKVIYFFNDESKEPLVGNLNDTESIKPIIAQMLELGKVHTDKAKSDAKQKKAAKDEEIYDKYADILHQAEEIAGEQYSDSMMAGGSDASGDAQFTKMEFLSSRIPKKYWKMFGIYDPHEDIRSRYGYSRRGYDEYDPDEDYGW